jgi:predicted dehydrogenase
MSHIPNGSEPGVSRRSFVASAAASLAAGSLLIGAGSASARPLARRSENGRPGPSGKINLGFIGAGKRAFELFPAFLDHADCRVVAVCDVDTTRREAAKKRVDEKYGATGTSGCPAFNDHRELLALKNVDAVVITTPDHWHAIQAIDAAKQGKDIYCEKPMTLNLAEGKAMIDAVRKHDRVFQTGSQQRTEFGAEFAKAIELVRSGRIGDVVTVHVGVPVRNNLVTSVPCNLPEEAMEPGLDWERWLGPAPKRAYNTVLSPRGVCKDYPDWRSYREYSGGMLTDFGAHHFDIAQWGLGMDESGPVEILPPKGNATFGARLIYANGVQVIHGGPVGITFTGTKGELWVDRGAMRCNPDSAMKDALKESEVHLPRAASHHQNWIDCIKSRQRCICDVEVGARSVACCHLVNLAYWHRKAMKWDPAKWEFVGDAEANGWRDYGRRAGYELPSA